MMGFYYGSGCRLENGDKSTTDGSDYYGVGFIHLTGKANYKKLHDTWKERYPEDVKDFMGDDISLLKSDVDVAMKASMIIWIIKKSNENGNTNADKGKDATIVSKVTKFVNGGTNGLDLRKKYTKKAYEVLGK